MLLLYGTAIAYVVFVLFRNITLYTRPFDAARSKARYDSSQWSQSQNLAPDKILDAFGKKQGYTGWNDYVDDHAGKENINETKTRVLKEVSDKGISDAELYSYVGYQYAVGTNPTLLNPEHPPLGKYLIGLSALLFHNENVILVITGAIILLEVGLVTYLISASSLAAGVAVFLTATHSLFIDQLIHGPQLDIFQLVFLLPLLYFLIPKKSGIPFGNLMAAGVFFGLFISVKTFFTYWMLLNLSVALILLTAKWSYAKRLRSLFLMNAVGLTVFLLTYVQYFRLGGTLKGLLGVQKYIFLFYRNSQIPVLEVLGNSFQLILTGTWRFWGHGIILSHYEYWSPAWTAVYGLGLVAILWSLREKKTIYLRGIFIFFVVYNAFAFLFPIFPRYLLLLYVPIHIVVGTFVDTILWQKNNLS